MDNYQALAIEAVKKAIDACPDATDGDLVVMAGNMGNLFSFTYDEQGDAHAVNTLRWALAYVKRGAANQPIT